MATSRTTKITTKPKTNRDMESMREEALKFFGTHLNASAGCKGGVFHTNRHSEGKDGKLIMSASILADIHERTYSYSDFYLNLTMLADISDEDAIEVVKACNGVLKRPNEEYDVFKNSFGKTVVGVVGGDFNNRYMIDEALPSEAIDKARELGYAYKWNGLSVEEQISRGWVRIKSKN